MEMFRKAILFSVGVVAIAYEEVEKSIRKTLDMIEDERKKITRQRKNTQAQ